MLDGSDRRSPPQLLLRADLDVFVRLGLLELEAVLGSEHQELEEEGGGGATGGLRRQTAETKTQSQPAERNEEMERDVS